MSGPRSPSMSNNGMPGGFNSYTGQLAVSVQENGNGQWTEGACPSFERVFPPSSPFQQIKKYKIVRKNWSRVKKKKFHVSKN